MTEPSSWYPTGRLYVVVPHPDGWRVAEVRGYRTDRLNTELVDLSVMINGAVATFVVEAQALLVDERGDHGRTSGDRYSAPPALKPVIFESYADARTFSAGANAALEAIGYADSFLLDDGRLPVIAKAALAADTAAQH